MQQINKIFFLTFSFIIISCCSVLAQQNKADSLLTVIKTAEEDTNKVKTLILLGKEIISTTGDLEKVAEYCDQAIGLAQKINYKKGNAQALSLLGTTFLYQGDFSTARLNYEAALDIFKVIDDRQGMSRMYSNIGLCYMYVGDYPNSLKSTKSALKIETELDDKAGIAGSYNNIGVVYQELGNYPEALNNYLESLKMKEEIGDRGGIANTLTNMGAIKELQKNFAEALKYHQASLKISMELEDQMGISDSYNNIGNIYKEQGNFNQALRSHFVSLKMKAAIGDKSGIAACYNNIGLIYESQGDSALKKGDKKISLTHRYPQALRSYAASFKIRMEMGEIPTLSVSLTNMGRVSIRLNRFDDAQKYLMAGLDSSKSIGNRKNIQDSYLQLSVLDSATGDMGGAFTNYKLYICYRDSLFNEGNAEKAAMTQMQFNIEREQDAEKRVEEDRRKRILRRNQLEYSVIVLVVLLVLVSVLLLGKIKVPVVVARGLSFVALLLVFESILVFLDQWIDVYTGGAPAKKLLVNIVLAVLIFPLNNFLERKVKKRLKVQ